MDVVGREAELAAVEAFVRGDGGRELLLIEGEAGIGKTTVWEHGVASAVGTVLAARPAGAEAELAFAGLGDLVRRVGDDVLARLPPPQRHALDVALLRVEPDARPEPRTLGVALLSMLGELARDAPVLVAVDDVQWLDTPSAAALAFALRRLEREPVRVLLALRSGEGDPPAGLERALPTERLALAPLSFGATRKLLFTALGAPLPRATLRRVYEISGGNPFYALELGRHAAAGATDLPPTLQGLLERRLGTLPPETLDALLVAAALADPRADLVPNALEPAYAAGIVREERGRVVFTHPLLRASVYGTASPERRRAVHRRLADVVADVEERAQHLSLAILAPDPVVAGEIERGAERASRRGAPESAAALFERAAELTPPDDEEARVRRLAAAALRHVEIGNERRASSLLRPLLDRPLPEEVGTQVLLVLARAESDWRSSREFANRALALVGDDPARRVRVLLTFAYAAMHRLDTAAVEQAEEAVRIAEGTADEALLLEALARLGWLLRASDAARAVAVLERALELEERVAPLDPYYGPATWLGWHWVDAERPDLARPLLERQYRLALRTQHEHHHRWLCGPLVELEIASGDLARARAYADEGLELAEEVGSAHSLSAFLCFRAHALALAGELDEARDAARRSLDLAEEIDSPLFVLRARRMLGLVELLEGNAGAAAGLLSPVEAELVSGGRSVTARSAEFETMDALVAAGEAARAEAVARAAEEHADRSPNGAVRALRLRGIVCVARGELDAAVDTLERALDLGADLTDRYMRARTLLWLGIARRRARRKRAARDALDEAVALFDAMAARPWAERARAELARVGGRQAAPDHALTPSERRVADLVAAGKSNKEVAAELVVTTRTVEAHLTKAYEKLGVRSRTELAAKLASE